MMSEGTVSMCVNRMTGEWNVMIVKLCSETAQIFWWFGSMFNTVLGHVFYFFVTIGNSVMFHVSYFNVIPAVSHTFVFLRKLLHISWLVESLCDSDHYWSNTVAAFSIKFSLNEGKWRWVKTCQETCSTKQR